MTNTVLKFLVIVSVCFITGCSKKINEEEFLLKSAERIVRVVTKKADKLNGQFPDGSPSQPQIRVSYNTKKQDSLTSPYLTEIIIESKEKHIRDYGKSWEEGPRLNKQCKATFSFAWEKKLGSDAPRWVFKVALGDYMVDNHMNKELYGDTSKKTTWLVDRLVGVESLDEVIRYSNPDWGLTTMFPNSYYKFAWEIADALKEQPIMGEDEIE